MLRSLTQNGVGLSPARRAQATRSPRLPAQTSACLTTGVNSSVMRFALRPIHFAILALFLFFSVGIGNLPAQPAAPASSSVGSLDYDLRSYSGTPLLLQLSLPANAEAERLIVESAESRHVFHLASPTKPPSEGERRVVPFSPFRRPGVHALSIGVETGAGGANDVDPAVQADFTVGFVDYVWGRDNFRFANDAEYRKSMDPYSVMLFEWLEERFGGEGEVGERERALIVHEMYTLFGKNAGRCYAFAGSQLRYYRRPDLLPRYYDSVYEVSERNRILRREMTFLQMDLVFHHFVEGRQLRRPERPQTRVELIELSERVQREIDGGSPVVIGLLSQELHHSVMVYGYIANPQRKTIDLIAANNWKRDQNVNIYSPDVENLRLHLGAEHEGRRIEWRNAKKRRTREPDRLFIAEVRREYRHNRAALDSLVETRLNDLQERQVALLVVEQADSAFLTDRDGSTSGYDKPRTTRGIDGVEFRRVQTSYQFTVPADGSYRLQVEHEGEARVFSVGAPKSRGAAAGTAPGAATGAAAVAAPSAAVISLTDSADSGLWRGRFSNGEIAPVAETGLP